MKKILFINDLVFGGGVENVMYETIMYLFKRGYDVTVFTPLREKNFYKAYPSSVKHIYYYRYSIRTNTFFSKVIKKILRMIKGGMYSEKYDTVVVMKEGPSVKEGLRYNNTDKRVAWIHADYKTLHWSKDYFVDNSDERNALAAYHTTICVTNAVRESLIEAIGDPGNLKVRYNPVKTDVILEKSKEPCILKKPEGKTLFVSVGRLCVEKGYKELLGAISEIDDRSKMELWIIGGGNDAYQKELESIIEEKGIGSTVKLLGAIDNPFPYMKQADFYVCSSKTESFCLTIQESLTLGVPIITTNCPGAIELMDSTLPIVVNNMDEMREKIAQILQNPEIVAEYKEKVKKLYKCTSAQDRLKEIEELF